MSGSEKILGVTGSFGYIGKRLLARLAETDTFEQVICTDILTTPDTLPQIYLLEDQC